MTRRRSFRLSLFALGILLPLLTTACGGSPKASNGIPESAVTGTQNPLVAQYQVNLFGAAKLWVEFGTNTSYGRQTSSATARGNALLSDAVVVLVAGMTPTTTYHMRAHADWPDGSSWVDQDQTFTTGPLPPGNTLAMTASRPAQASARAVPQQGVELLNLIAPGGNANNIEAAVSDLDGNIIWYYTVDAQGGYIPFPIKQLDNGHMLVNISNFLGAGNVTSLREIDLAGDTVRELSWDALDQELAGIGFPFSVSLHHDLLPLPTGHLIVLANITKEFTDLPGYPGTIGVIGDVLIDLDPNWKPVWIWSSFDHLDVNRHLQGLPDWTHSNAVVYTPNDGNLLLSIRHQSWILKIDYENGHGSGNILWKLGHQGDFAISGGDPSQWFYGQHYPNILQINGSQITLALVDNGNLRILDDTGTTCGIGTAPSCYSRAAIFQVDESARTATPVWQYLPGYFSFWGGSIQVMPSGNIEVDFSAYDVGSVASQVFEVTKTTSPAVVWEMNMSESAYRAYRIPSLYPGVVWTR